MLTQEFWLVLLARAVIGLLAAWLVGAGAFFIAFYFVFTGGTSFAVLTPTFVTISAVGTGVGATAAWFHSGKRRAVAGLAAAILTSSAIGGWAGFLAGAGERDRNLIDIQTGEVVSRPGKVTGLITRPGLQATLFGGAVAANAMAAALYVARAGQKTARGR